MKYPSKWTLWCLLYVALLSYILVFQNFLLPHFNSLHAGNGVLRGDNELFYRLAVEMADKIKLNGLSAWQLFPDQAAGLNVSLPSLIFYIFGSHLSVLAPLTCLLHIIAAYILFTILTELNIPAKATVIAILCFAFFPTTLIWVSQMHKDSYSILGWFLLFLSFMYTYKAKSPMKILAFSVISTALLMCVRPMYLNIMLISLVVFGIGVFRTKKSFAYALLIAIPLMIGNLIFYKADIINVKDDEGLLSFDEFKCDKSWTPSSFLPRTIDVKLQGLAFVRNKQICYMPENVNSNIHMDFYPLDANSIIKFTPVAMFTGLLEPTPMTIARIGNIQAYVIFLEMIFYYFAVLLLVIQIFRKQISKPMLWLLIPAVLVMTLLSISTPNLGTLQRVRFPFFMMFFAIGSSQIFSLWDAYKNRKST